MDSSNQFGEVCHVFDATFTPSSRMCASKVWCSKSSFHCSMVCNDGNIVTIKTILEDTTARIFKSVIA